MAATPPVEVYRYPLTAFTDSTDYLQIDIVKYVPIRGTDTEKASFSGKSRSRNVNQRKQTREGTILLPVPSIIEETNGVKYGDPSLNSIAGAALGGIKNIMESGKFATDQNKNFFDELGKSAIDSIKNTSAEAGGIAGAQGFVTRSLASKAIGILGANISADQILARGTGEILNPNMELLFNGVTLRKFSFNYKFMPRNNKEGEEVKKIIRKFKYHSAAKLGTRQKELTAGLETFIRTPDVFELRYRKGGGEHPYLHKFKQCFLESVSVNYTGEGLYSTYSDGTPVSINMGLTFNEIEPIYDQDQQEAGGSGF